MSSAHQGWRRRSSRSARRGPTSARTSPRSAAEHDPVVEALPAAAEPLEQGRVQRRGRRRSRPSGRAVRRARPGPRTPRRYAAASRRGRRRASRCPAARAGLVGRERRLVHEVGLARPAAVDRGLAWCRRGSATAATVRSAYPTSTTSSAAARQHGLVDPRVARPAGGWSRQVLVSLRDHRNVKGASMDRRPVVDRRPRGAAVHAGGRGDPRPSWTPMAADCPLDAERPAREGAGRDRASTTSGRRTTGSGSTCFLGRGPRHRRAARARRPQLPHAAAPAAQEPAAADRPAQPSTRRSTRSSWCRRW